MKLINNLILLLVAVGLSAVTLGCGGPTDAAVSSSTDASTDYVTETDFQGYVFGNNKAWEDAEARLNYLKTEQDKIKKGFKRHGKQIARLKGNAGGHHGPLVIKDMTGFRESPSGSSGHPVHGGWLCYATVGTPPSVDAHRATDPAAFPPTPPSILEMVEKRFGKVDERFGKVDERLDSVEARVTKLENGASHPTPAPKPAPVPKPEPEAE